MGVCRPSPVPPPAPGWDISSLNLAEAMRRAQVLDWGLQEQLWPHLEALRPRPSVYIPEFIAANQSARADNLILGTRAQQVRPRPKPCIPCHLLLLPFAPSYHPPSLPSHHPSHPTPPNPGPPALLAFCLLVRILRFQTSLCTWGRVAQTSPDRGPVQPPSLPAQLEQIRRDIRDFRSSAGLDKVIVLWTANTERFCEVVPGLNDTAENLLRTIQVSASRVGKRGQDQPQRTPPS